MTSARLIEDPMKRRIIIATLVLSSAGCAGNEPQPELLVGEPKVIHSVIAEDAALTIAIPAGEASIRGVDGNQLYGMVEVRCASLESNCAKQAKKIEFTTESRDDSVHVGLEPDRAFGYRHGNIKITIDVPKVKNLQVLMGPGDLDITDIRGCVSVDMDAGDVDVTAPVASIDSVYLDANIGDASLRIPEQTYEGNRTWLVGAKVEWDEGTGPCKSEVLLQAGDINVNLH